MECGQRMQQGQGQGIHRIEYLYCGVTRTCPRETQGTGIGTGPDYPETDPETCFRERHRNAYTARYHDGRHRGNGNTGRHRLLSRYDQPVQERGEEIAAAYPLLLWQGGYHLP